MQTGSWAPWVGAAKAVAVCAPAGRRMLLPAPRHACICSGSMSFRGDSRALAERLPTAAMPKVSASCRLDFCLVRTTPCRLRMGRSSAPQPALTSLAGCVFPCPTGRFSVSLAVKPTTLEITIAWPHPNTPGPRLSHPRIRSHPTPPRVTGTC
eukprot:364380-Chlamydomonas_euryale.AAC.8